jgi:hypothetical protein
MLHARTSNLGDDRSRFGGSGAGRFCLGIGARSQAIVEFWNGGKFEHATTRVREMV